MAKFRMNHSSAGRGKGAGALVIRVAGVFFIIFFLMFLFAGKQKMSQSLEQSILFPDEEPILMDILDVELDTLINNYFGHLTGHHGEKVYYALIPSCTAFQSDSTVFNQLYFVNPDWVPLGSAEYYDYFKSSNLTGKDYSLESKKLNGADSTCHIVILEVSNIEGAFNYSMEYLNDSFEVLGLDTLSISYQGF